MEYEIQIDNGLGGHCYERFSCLVFAVEWANDWARKCCWKFDSEVRVQVRQSDEDGWEYDEVLKVKANWGASRD